MMRQRAFERLSGILLPVSSLPSPYGIGNLGKAADWWIDFLHDAGQGYWQILPFGPTAFGDSPYQSCSAFAGNTYLIDPDTLVSEGLLTEAECAAPDWGSGSKIDYEKLFNGRESLLRKAYTRFNDQEALKAFCAENAFWIEDYALYMAVKTQNGMKPWQLWPDEIRLREPETLNRLKKELQEDIDFHCFTQYLFYTQWAHVKQYANERGVKLIGDIPIYVAYDSADVWANGELFQLDENRLPTAVAGVPPDAFSETGQLWGNPLYAWDRMKEDGYDWWMRRLRFNLSKLDILRIDHFRGLESYYAIPYGSQTAKKGRWKKGPGVSFLRAIEENIGESPPIIAEDLGLLTVGVKKLLKRSGYPGMKVLQFAFDASGGSDYLPHRYPRHCVVYTGTHDNDTVRGWFQSMSEKDVQFAMDYLGITKKNEGNWAFIRAALTSVADTAIIPMQDFLNLDSRARINMPSTLGGNNWRWRLDAKSVTQELAKKIRRVTEIYGRLPESSASINCPEEESDDEQL